MSITSADDNPSTSHRHVLLNFVVSIAASWFASPLGVFFLHRQGYGDDPHLISLLIALSASAPFQLLFNEYVAAQASRTGQRPNLPQMGAVLGAQIVVTMVVSATFGEATGRLDAAERLALSLLLAMSTLLSYRIALRYYGLTLRGETNIFLSAAIGATPGLVMLSVFIVAGMTRFSEVILLGALLPTIAQYILVHRLGSSTTKMLARPLRWTVFGGAIFGLGVIAAGNAIVRGEIGFLNHRFAALILTALNLVGTVVLMTGRARYLVGGGQFGWRLGILAAACCGTGLVGLSVVRPVGLLLLFIGLQFATAAGIGALRQISN